MADLQPFDLRSFDADVEARADLERVRAELRTVEGERDRIRDEARREGLEQARREAFDEAAKAIAAETAALGDLLRKAASAVEATQTELAAAGERDLVKLALAIAAKIVKAAVVLDRPVAEENLRRAVELTARRRELRVLLHPDDLKRIDTYLPALRRDFSDVQVVTLDADPSVARGGVIVQTREGSVDATLAAQLDQIERGLLG
ncbi:MAG TPA: FliH/SctL family protein [Planctomycetota bacterium]|nr:FliH/SctL family protein [Planctomycetota bacterium]